jgi:hypothetical protein
LLQTAISTEIAADRDCCTQQSQQRLLQTAISTEIAADTDSCRRERKRESKEGEERDREEGGRGRE